MKFVSGFFTILLMVLATILMFIGVVVGAVACVFWVGVYSGFCHTENWAMKMLDRHKILNKDPK